MSTPKIKEPQPIPLKKLLRTEGRTQRWLSDELSRQLDERVTDTAISLVLGGRSEAPLKWVEALMAILPHAAVTVDKAQRLLGLKNGSK